MMKPHEALSRALGIAPLLLLQLVGVCALFSCATHMYWPSVWLKQLALITSYGSIATWFLLQCVIAQVFDVWALAPSLIPPFYYLVVDHVVRMMSVVDEKLLELKASKYNYKSM